ncbi:MAG: hypothetical protein U9Q06_01860 [Nanoarchaeota archaeon]|nr:hypothetical protein [Nanoarchaeota archaeon]
MRYFLDMNLPIYFCMQFGHPLEKKAEKFVSDKKDNTFLLCDYIFSRNLPGWLKRQKIILFEFNQKVQESSYQLFSSNNAIELFHKDKLFTKKLVMLYIRSQDKKQFIQEINNIFNFLNKRISNFIKKYIDEVVIPEIEIDTKLKSCLSTWLRNNSDVKTIASAIQEHRNKKLTIMTADKKDWTKDLLEEVYNNLELSKTYLSLPKIEYLQNYSL